MALYITSALPMGLRCKFGLHKDGRKQLFRSDPSVHDGVEHTLITHCKRCGNVIDREFFNVDGKTFGYTGAEM